MTQPRTHFEQIPLEIVKKIAKEEIQPEETSKPAQGIKKRHQDRDRWRASRRRSLGSKS
jgi:hypothetical protein